MSEKFWYPNIIKKIQDQNEVDGLTLSFLSFGGLKLYFRSYAIHLFFMTSQLTTSSNLLWYVLHNLRSVFECGQIILHICTHLCQCSAIMVIEVKFLNLIFSILSFDKVLISSLVTHVRTHDYAGHALGIWICGCSLFYKRELWASKSVASHSTKSLKISGCKR